MALFFFGIIHCSSQNTEAKIEKPIEISLEELIEHSNKYEKKHIVVYGYVKFEKQMSRIFFSEEDLKKNNLEKSVAFMFLIEQSTLTTVKTYDGKSVQMSGIYIPGKAIGSGKKLKMENGVITSVKIQFPLIME